MSLSRYLLVVCTWIAACGAPVEQQATPAAVEDFVEAGERRPAGFRAELVSASAPRRGSPWRLQLRLERGPRFIGPLHVSVRPPPGVTLRAGLGRTLREQFAPGVGEVTYEFEVNTAPRGELVVELDARGTAAGYHAELHYGMGVARPSTAAPRRAGPPVRVAGHSLGAAVEMLGASVSR